MSHSFRRVLNKFTEEGSLRNCLPEIKDVSKAEMNTVKQRFEAAKEVVKWGKEQDDEIANLMATMNEFEIELNTHATQFVDTYNATYYTRWKEILKDRAELRDVIQAHKKAKAKVEKAMEKVESCKKKTEKTTDPVKAADNLKAAEAELPEIAAAEARAGQLVKEKVLEVQKEMHEHIRYGYYNMHDARMKFYHDAALVSERALAATARFPGIKGTGPDGDFEFEAYPMPPGPNSAPIWHKGDEYFKQLQEQINAAKLGLDSQMGKMREDMEKEIAQLKQALETERDGRQRAVRDAVNSGSDQLNRELLQIVLAMGSQNVADASEGIERDIVEYLNAKSREAHDATLALADSPVSNLPILARTIFGTVFSAVGTAYTLEPALGKQLFGLARQVAKAARDLFDDMTARAAADPSGATLGSSEFSRPLQDALRAMMDFATAAALPVGSGPVDRGVTAAQKSILEAQDAIASMKDRSEKTDNDRVKELNMNILNESADMFTSARSLIDACVALHSSLNQNSTEQLSESESKLRIRKLTTALNDAVANIVANTPVWIECARQVTKTTGKFEELQVCSKDISACSAQLLAFARTTLAGSGQNVDVLVRSAERLQSGSHAVIAAVREAHQYQLASIVIDECDGLNETQVKKMIMASQISLQKLESQLEKERDRLARLRRMSYAEEKKKSATDVMVNIGAAAV